MTVFPTLYDFVAACRTTERVSELWSNSLIFMTGRGISMISYHSDDAQTAGSESLGLVASGFPGTWVCRYLARKLHLIDPIPRLASVTSRPFRWSVEPQLMKLSSKGARCMRILAGSGLGDGIAPQLFGPNPSNACVGVGFGGSDPGLSADDIFELQCAVQIAHIRCCESAEARQGAQEALSRRETEILGVSRHTVDAITRRNFSKLDVNDRTTAAIRGLGAGLVQHRRAAVMKRRYGTDVIVACH